MFHVQIKHAEKIAVISWRIMTERNTTHDKLLVWDKHKNILVVTKTGSRDSLGKILTREHMGSLIHICNFVGEVTCVSQAYFWRRVHWNHRSATYILWLTYRNHKSTDFWLNDAVGPSSLDLLSFPKVQPRLFNALLLDVNLNVVQIMHVVGLDHVRNMISQVRMAKI